MGCGEADPLSSRSALPGSGVDLETMLVVAERARVASAPIE